MQGIFYLQNEQEALLQDYIVTPYNRETYGAIMNADYEYLGHEPFKHFVVLYGPQRSGKTHLASLWACKNQAIFLDPSHLSCDLSKYSGFIIDDIHLLPSHELLHLFNLVNDLHKPCILTALSWPLETEILDLQSRMMALRTLEFKTPDYAMVYQIIAQQLQLRNLNVAEGVVRYLCLRLPADLGSIMTAIKVIDELSLVEKVNVTVPFVRKVLHLL